MAERKSPSLTEVLNAFRKEADELMPVQQAPMEQQQMQPMYAAPAPEPVTPTSPIVQAAKQIVEAAREVEMTEDNIQNASARMAGNAQKLEGAADVLKSIAKEASLKHEEAMYKEASLFGQIFATTVLDEFQKQAQMDSVQEEAYAITMDKLASDELEPMLDKVAEEAYALCLTKLAFDGGYGAVTPEGEAPQQMQQQMPEQMPTAPQGPMDPNSPFPPQQYAEQEPEPQYIEQAPQQSSQLEEATAAAHSAAEAARSAAEAARAAVEAATQGSSPEQASEVAEALPKVAHEAYMATMEYMGKEASDNELEFMLQKVAEEAYSLIMGDEAYSDEDVDGMLNKVAAEAYDIVMQAV